MFKDFLKFEASLSTNGALETCVFIVKRNDVEHLVVGMKVHACFCHVHNAV